MVKLGDGYNCRAVQMGLGRADRTGLKGYDLSIQSRHQRDKGFCSWRTGFFDVQATQCLAHVVTVFFPIRWWTVHLRIFTSHLPQPSKKKPVTLVRIEFMTTGTKVCTLPTVPLRQLTWHWGCEGSKARFSTWSFRWSTRFVGTRATDSQTTLYTSTYTELMEGINDSNLPP